MLDYIRKKFNFTPVKQNLKTLEMENSANASTPSKNQYRPISKLKRDLKVNYTNEDLTICMVHHGCDSIDELLTKLQKRYHDNLEYITDALEFVLI